MGDDLRVAGEHLTDRGPEPAGAVAMDDPDLAMARQRGIVEELVEESGGLLDREADQIDLRRRRFLAELSRGGRGPRRLPSRRLKLRRRVRRETVLVPDTEAGAPDQ